MEQKNNNIKYNNFFKTHFFDRIKKFSVGNKLFVIIALIIFILIFELFNFWLAMKITAGIRTYVNAEGLYSKGQKEAYNGLLKYYTSRDEVDYNEFLMKLENHNFSARDFRLELN